jgi:hypothetical protein
MKEAPRLRERSVLIRLRLPGASRFVWSQAAAA